MKLLLDTHILVWGQVYPERLTRRVAQALADPANQRWVSPISIWEISNLVRRQRIALHQDLSDWVATTRAKAPWQEAPLTVEVAIRASGLTMHGDPADRFLAATALVYGLTLVTADQQLLRLGSLDCLAN